MNKVHWIRYAHRFLSIHVRNHGKILSILFMNRLLLMNFYGCCSLNRAHSRIAHILEFRRNHLNPYENHNSRQIRLVMTDDFQHHEHRPHRKNHN